MSDDRALAVSRCFDVGASVVEPPGRGAVVWNDVWGDGARVGNSTV